MFEVVGSQLGPQLGPGLSEEAKIVGKQPSTHLSILFS